VNDWAFGQVDHALILILFLSINIFSGACFDRCISILDLPGTGNTKESNRKVEEAGDRIEGQRGNVNSRRPEPYDFIA
jgi:hypothetical protein